MGMCLKCGNHSGPSGYCRTCDPNQELINQMLSLERTVSSAAFQAAPEDDRDRRIRELVREWCGHSEHIGDRDGEMERLFTTAAARIDAIDDAVVPPKESSRV